MSSARTGIEWTDTTWNPVTGCTKVSAGCDNCYAATLAARLLRTHYTARLPIVDTTQNRADPFAVRIWPDRLIEPASWRDPRMVFVNSMSDLFHKDIPTEFIRRIFAVMSTEAKHIYQVLTKRPARAARFLRENRDLFPTEGMPRHIWLGTSVESQEVAFRVDHLRGVSASVRFVSCEPLLGPVDLDLTGIHWVIAGGESGPVRRPMDLDWVRILRDRCASEDVAFFFKQVGGRTPKAGGRLLDGRTWDEVPFNTMDLDSEPQLRARAL